mmetsp:Transcript_13163/g.24493  ORF Transcript_13163/g.24493 Transcript_13163/m.24493 type:complete len:379 (-) Transcript_13163:183-1319(-)
MALDFSMELSLEDCVAALGRERAVELLAPHVVPPSAAPKAPEPPAGLPYRRVACVGVGTVGASWAAFFASQGLEVSMFDQNLEALERGMDLAKGALDRLEQAGVLQPGMAAVCSAKLLKAETVEASVSNADFVQETVFEDYKVKGEVWKQIEKYAPAATVIASSTSGLLISKMSEVLNNPERALVAHPFNPPHMINLVELVPGPKTDDAVLQSVKTFYTLLGKAPVVLLKEVAGHIANRLAGAVWRESVSLVHQGVATVQDVDTALHEGPGVRWAIMGQHAIYDLGGGAAGYRGFFEGPIGKGCFEPVWASMEHWDTAPTDAKEASIAGIERWHEEAGRTRAELASWRDSRLARIVMDKRLNPPPQRKIKPEDKQSQL